MKTLSKLFGLKYNSDTPCRKGEYVHKANFWYKIESTRLQENNFTQNKYNKLQKNKWFFPKNKCKSANMGSSTVQLYGVDLIDIQIQNCL